MTRLAAAVMITTLCALTLLLAACASEPPGRAPDFRVYSANSLKQQRQILVPSNAARPGCHNLLITREVYRVAQVGFGYCVIYSQKDCKAGTEINVSWQNKKDPTSVITQGARWFLPGELGSDMASWKCVLPDEK